MFFFFSVLKPFWLKYEYQVRFQVSIFEMVFIWKKKPCSNHFYVSLHAWLVPTKYDRYMKWHVHSKQVNTHRYPIKYLWFIWQWIGTFNFEKSKWLGENMRKIFFVQIIVKAVVTTFMTKFAGWRLYRFLQYIKMNIDVFWLFISDRTTNLVKRIDFTIEMIITEHILHKKYKNFISGTT